MRKTVLAMFTLFLVMWISASSVSAAVSDFDFVSFARERVLNDFHPTADASRATAELEETPYERAVVRIGYGGWLREHYMTVAIDLRHSDNAVRVTVLEDTNGMNIFGVGNKLFKKDKWISLQNAKWR